jgi:tRNA-splicing ligase RtcB (3'-phosphate/5'-hydroxy nucleic acid ligase)
MPVRQEISEGRVPVKVYTGEVEAAARQQLVNISRLPIVHHHVAAMPDVHLGIGATVGSVIPTLKAIIPAAVGVDIGCGMMAARLSLTGNELDEVSLRKVFGRIEREVPVGFSQHSTSREGAQRFRKDLSRILEKHPGIEKRKGKKSSWAHQLGTLGGGNHFIEICLDESNRAWVMLHSGSRGIGNAIGSYFIELAKKDFQKNSAALPDRDLAYFPEGAQHFDDYVEAVGWAQDYARANREEMMDLVLDAMRRHLPAFEVTGAAVNCHHNYVQRETHYGEQVWLTRKGAIRAGEGELGIIPGSMGARSYIVRGKGAAESFHSCAHGAGRRMSRNHARKHFSVENLIEQTKGVVCRKDPGVLDEIPGAYKDIDQVMANQSDLVEVVHTLKQVLCVKG